MMGTALAANRLALASVGAAPPQSTEKGPEDSEIAVKGGECRGEWDTDRPAGTAESVSVGDRVTLSKTLTEADVRRFANASGDTNPLHLDADAATASRFDGRIVHGTLVGGVISAAIARFPGDVIYLSQEFEFQNPVRIDDRVTAEVEIVEDLGEGRYRLRTTVYGDDVAVDGEALVLIEAKGD